MNSLLGLLRKKQLLSSLTAKKDYIKMAQTDAYITSLVYNNSLSLCYCHIVIYRCYVLTQEINRRERININ